MLLRLLCLPLLLTTCLSICATAADAQAPAKIYPLGHPWMIEQEDGSLRIGILLPAQADPLVLGAIKIVDESDQLLDLNRSWQMVRGGGVGKQQRMLYTIQVDSAKRYGITSINLQGVGDGILSIKLPKLKPLDQESRILCVGHYNYPLLDDIELVEKTIGASIDAVLIIGQRCTHRIGTGQWEHRIPIVVMHEAGTPEEIIRSEQYICGKAPAWPSGFAHGCIAFPSASHDDLNLSAINRYQHDWKIFIDRDARWDPCVSSRSLLKAKRMRRLLAVATRQRIPFILSGGSGSMFISEPLFVQSYQFAEIALRNQYINEQQYELVKKTVSDSGRSVRAVMLDMGLLNRNQVETISQGMINKPIDSGLTNHMEGISVKAGGTRYLSVNSAGLSFRPISNEIALPIYQKSFMVVQASPQHCSVKLIQTSGQICKLDYVKKAEAHSSGWGTWDASLKDLKSVKPEELSEEELQHVSWLTHMNLNGAFAASSFRLQTSLDFAQTLSAQGNHVLLRRFMQLNAVVAMSWVYQQNDPPVDVRRDALLRNIADVQHLENHDFQDLIINNNDHHILRSILASLKEAKKEQRLELIDLLVKRIERQEAGQLGLDDDPMLQHQLMTAVFESPYHSPTPLRPLAKYMRAHGHPFAVGKSSPIQRFFDRHGEEEP